MARERVRGAGGLDVAPAVLVPAAAFFDAIIADGEEEPDEEDGSRRNLSPTWRADVACRNADTEDVQHPLLVR